MKHLLHLAISLLALLSPSIAFAHAFAPVSVQLVETADYGVNVTVRSSNAVEPIEESYLALPDDCRVRAPASLRQGAAETTLTSSFACSEPLRGKRIHLRPDADTRRHIVLTAVLADGSTIQQILVRGETSFLLESSNGDDPQHGAAVSELQPLAYLWIGVEHIWFGFDHLLFVLCLVLLIKSRRRLFWTVTAFTLAHSVTLGLAALGVVHVPGPPVEATIALSIVLLAIEAVRGEAGVESLTSRLPWLVALLFGLIHGLGFAGALSDIGLPESQEIAALAFFNVGVELGQVAFVLVALLLGYIAERFLSPLKAPSRIGAAWLSGCIASYWLVDRVAGFYNF